jgi:hypothetical protein
MWSFSISDSGKGDWMVSPSWSGSSLKAAMTLGAVDYLEKPLEDEVVVRTVERLLVAGRNAQQDVDTPVAHAAARWAEAVLRIIAAEEDPRTLSGWSRAANASVGTLRNYCSRAHLSAKHSLDLGRLLRAVSRARSSGVPPDQLLDVADRRTLKRLILDGELTDSGPLPTLDELLARQSFVIDPVAISELRRVLSRMTAATRSH